MKTLKELKKGSSKGSKINKILFFIIVMVTVNFSMGYSLLNVNLYISGEANFRPQIDLRVTNVKFLEVTNGALINYDNYSKNVISAGFDLENLSSTISYEVTLTNFSNVEMKISDINQTINNFNVIYNLDEIVIDEEGEKSLNSVGSFVGLIFSPGEQRTFVLTFSYSDRVTELPEQISVDGSIEFEFIINVVSKLAEGNTSTTFFNGNIAKNYVETITVSPTMSVGENSLGSWDASLEGDGSVVAWYTDLDQDGLYEVTLGCNETLLAPANSMDLFRGFSNATKINFNDLLDTSNVTDMSGMFSGCSNLTSLDLSSFNTSKVTDMRYMFSYNSNLTSLDLSSFNTSKVTDMSSMFSGCSNLKYLNLSSFTNPMMEAAESSIPTMTSAFGGCSSLETLDMRNWIFYNEGGDAIDITGLPSNMTIYVDAEQKNYFEIFIVNGMFNLVGV